MKKVILLLLIFVFVGKKGNAQMSEHKLSLGVNIGYSKAFMDTQQSDVNLSFGGSADMYISPYIFLSGNFHHGKFSQLNPDKYGRGFSTVFNQLNASVNLKSGMFFKPDFRSAYLPWYHVYVGVGVGAVITQMNEANLAAPDANQLIGGVRLNQQAFVLPINVGVNFNILGFNYDTPFSINLNYQHNLSFNDNLDGYNPTFDNKYKDAFGVATIGFRYNFLQRAFVAKNKPVNPAPQQAQYVWPNRQTEKRDTIRIVHMYLPEWTSTVDTVKR
ncbi:hypothetical protein NF867_15825 [Solitalea sp. MAHUQ-68]|uniref:Outer membrane protein beta-barrel domain-containing protein n=1 Tax=Solitalea agri TaxID=2953739 RepID=A0A9X2F8K2_9SPHI|nr:outer membrane beta-barrel protein [Solitalea agri]MCO4294331.1 hypothetical protein [Solitalea agri]